MANKEEKVEKEELVKAVEKVKKSKKKDEGDVATATETKAVEDLIIIYERERLNSRKIDILNLLEQSKDEEKRNLEKELSDIIIKLAKLNRSI